jgi:hypothetical protein
VRVEGLPDSLTVHQDPRQTLHRVFLPERQRDQGTRPI